MKEQEKTQRLWILRGLPGSGKTTYAFSTLRKENDIRQFEADMFFLSPKGEYRFNPRRIGEAHAWCQKSTREALEKGQSVAVSNTFTQLWEMSPYLSMAEELGVEVEIIHLQCSKETSQKRNIHGCPAETIEKMISRWEPFPKEKIVVTD